MIVVPRGSPDQHGSNDGIADGDSGVMTTGVTGVVEAITYGYLDPKDVATLRILDDGNQVGTTVHLDVSSITGLDQVFLAGAIPSELGHDSTTKDINIYGAGTTVTSTQSSAASSPHVTATISVPPLAKSYPWL